MATLLVSCAQQSTRISVRTIRRKALGLLPARLLGDGLEGREAAELRSTVFSSKRDLTSSPTNSQSQAGWKQCAGMAPETTTAR